MPKYERQCRLPKAIASSLVLLAGCAMTPDRVAGMSDSRLCYAQATAGSLERQRMYEAELGRRKTTCTEQMLRMESDRVAQQREADKRAAEAVGQALSRPQMPVRRPAVTCTTDTYSYPGQTTTTCR